MHAMQLNDRIISSIQIRKLADGINSVAQNKSSRTKPKEKCAEGTKENNNHQYTNYDFFIDFRVTMNVKEKDNDGDDIVDGEVLKMENNNKLTERKT